jgi:hypothetical protein
MAGGAIMKEQCRLFGLCLADGAYEAHEISAFFSGWAIHEGDLVATRIALAGTDIVLRFVGVVGLEKIERGSAIRETVSIFGGEFQDADFLGHLDCRDGDGVGSHFKGFVSYCRTP